MLIDIDRFKSVNSRGGHLYGDVVLESLASHLLDLFDSTDVIGRMEGDVFAVFHKGIVNESEISEAAESICNMFRGDLPELKKDNKITVSVGISVYPKDGITYDDLLKKADLALCEVKSSGKDDYYLYDSNKVNHNNGELERKRNHRKKKHSRYTGITDAEKRLLDFTFEIISNSTDAEASLNTIFTEIGKYYDLSRITIFEKATQNQKSRISYEWLNEGVSSCQASFINSLDTIINVNEQLLKKNGILYSEDAMKMDVGPYIKKMFKKIGTHALLQCKITDSNQYIGSVNFENCTKPHIWEKTEIDTLSTITKIISNYILQLRNKEELRNEIFFTQAMLDNQKLSNYAINSDTYELLYVNKYTENIVPDVKLGEVCYKAIFNRSTPCETCPLQGLNESRTRYSIEAYNEKMDAWYSKTASTVTMPNGQKMYFICSSDVTAIMERVKSKDDLTGLLTLPKFKAEAMKLLASAKNINYAIIYSDFNKFKYINDEWGYSVGDEILKFFTARVSRLLSSSELFCRIGGDIFTVLLSYREKSDVLERINMLSNNVSQDFTAKFPKVNPIFISGVYFLTPEDKILSVALDKANMARKSLKGYHKSSYAIYDDELYDEIKREKLIEDRMHNALINDEFVVYMQPKVDLRSLVITGAEALTRWKTPDGCIMNPMEFIPIFEKNGFIVELDFYIYEKVLKKLRSWLDEGKHPIIVSLNVSRLHIEDALFVEKLEHLLEKYNIPRNLIEIEITENIFVKSLSGLIDMLNNLHRRGYIISIDDFGSGYSSLNLLKTLPVDIIKLDKEFFLNNKMEEKNKIVINSIIQLAKGLGLKVISEGVETLEQAEFLRESRCDMVQGFFFYKPMPLEDFAKIIE
jgi:diguanylate cyclase (GGDEF)-like protein